MFNYFNNDLEIILTIIGISLLIAIIYDLIRNHGKFYFKILKPKFSIQNKNTWSEENSKISDKTKGAVLDFKLQLYNHKKYYSSIYNIEVKKKKGLKKYLLNNPYLNLTDTAKMVTGAINFEKLKYATLLPYEIREFSVKIKLTKDELESIKKQPIYITYKIGRRKKKIKLNKFLRKN